MKLHSGLVIAGLFSLGLLSYSCANGDTVSGSTGTGGSSTGNGGSDSTGTGGTHTGGVNGTGTGGTHTGGVTGTGGIITGTGGTHTGGVTGTGGISSTGGITGTGGIVTTGTGGSSSMTCGTAFTVSAAGFVSMPAVGGGCWSGFASDGGDAGSTIMPGTFATCGTPCMLTMTGTLNASVSPTYAGYSYLGFNIGQDASGSANTAVAPKGSGITVTFTNTSAAPVVRVALNADATGTTSWCAPVTTSPATILYSAFTQACYTPGGAPYTKQPIVSVQLSVPGGPTSAPVNVTLVSVKENP